MPTRSFAISPPEILLSKAAAQNLFQYIRTTAQPFFISIFFLVFAFIYMAFVLSPAEAFADPDAPISQETLDRLFSPNPARVVLAKDQSGGFKVRSVEGIGAWARCSSKITIDLEVQLLFPKNEVPQAFEKGADGIQLSDVLRISYGAENASVLVASGGGARFRLDGGTPRAFIQGLPGGSWFVSVAPAVEGEGAIALCSRRIDPGQHGLLIPSGVRPTALSVAVRAIEEGFIAERGQGIEIVGRFESAGRMPQADPSSRRESGMFPVLKFPFSGGSAADLPFNGTPIFGGIKGQVIFEHPLNGIHSSSKVRSYSVSTMSLKKPLSISVNSREAVVQAGECLVLSFKEVETVETLGVVGSEPSLLTKPTASSSPAE